jgi:hypothetical protein
MVLAGMIRIDSTVHQAFDVAQIPIITRIQKLFGIVLNLPIISEIDADFSVRSSVLPLPVSRLAALLAVARSVATLAGHPRLLACGDAYILWADAQYRDWVLVR